MSKERPIIFSAPMIHAILEGRKTQTRRIIKPQPKLVHAFYWDGSIETERIYRDSKYRQKCPYGIPGDRLWVRETHTFGNCNIDDPSWVDVIYKADPPAVDGDMWPQHRTPTTEEQAEEAWEWVENKEDSGDGGMNWRSPLHTHRWASRITLEITGVKVERVQDISEGDAIAEGWKPGVDAVGNGGPFDWYAHAWDKINGEKPGASWADNPWVWCIEFKMVGGGA